MRIFTADNETVLTFAGTLFTIETARAFVSHPPFSLASPAIPRLAAAPGQEPRSPIPDRPHRLPAPSTTPLAPSPRHHSTILFHSRALIARIALESRRARVPFRRFVPVPRERRADRLGRHRRPETSLAHRGSHRDARAATHRVRRHFFYPLSRADGGRSPSSGAGSAGAARRDRARVGNVRRGRSWLTHSAWIVTGQFSTGHDSRIRPIARVSRARAPTRARETPTGGIVDGDRPRVGAARPRRSFVRSFVRSSARGGRRASTGRRGRRARARGRTGARDGARAREREKGVDAGGGRR